MHCPRYWGLCEWLYALKSLALLQEYALTAEETIFIDDMAVNLEAAARFGIRTIRFENPEQCAERLRELNLLYRG